MNKLIAVALVAATVFVGTFSAQYAFKADYLMRNTKVFPNGYVTGTLYYRYDSDNALNSRLRYETSYSLDGTSVVSTDLYYYGTPKALYSFCDTCAASTLAGDLEPWWKINGDKCTDLADGFMRCTRGSDDSHGVVEMVVKNGDPSTTGFAIKSITLNDGNELELTGYSSFTFGDGRFDIPTNPKCPDTVECRNYMDLVFVLDTSGSVDKTEWQQTRNFVSNVVKQIKIGQKDAYVGVIDFNGPTNCKYCPPEDTPYVDITSYGCKVQTTQRCQGGADDCKRYLTDYLFDQNCKPSDGSTATVLMNLTQQDVVNKVGKLSQGFGMTCQRYGLNLAYDMLFNNNPRCKSGVCPTPVVIVVTDGWDNCHASTITAAARLRTEMEKRGGFLLEVGVGLTNLYDKEYVSNLSSVLAGYSAYYDVTNYAAIETVIKNVLTPVCELTQLGGTCGPTCRGFCACSKCVCPMCGGNTTNFCKTYQCDKANADSGCSVGNVSCVDSDLERTKCYDMWCDADEPDPNKKCKTKVKDCKTELEARLKRPLKACEYVPECQNYTVGCSVGYNHTYCQQEVQHGNCRIGQCVGDGGDEYGCKFVVDNCTNSPLWDVCSKVTCNQYNNLCQANQRDCNIDECTKIENGALVPVCEDRPCQKTKCEKGQCSYEPLCKPSNLCMKSTCEQDTCVEEPYDSLNCSSRNTLCKTYTCDPEYDDGKGGCKSEDAYHEETECTKYVCDETDGWKAVPRCTTDVPCKVAKCLSGGKCYDEDIDCREVLGITDKCHDGACSDESNGCQLTVVPGTYIDICGNCKSENQGDAGDDEDEAAACVDAPPKEVTREGLAGAAVALIVIGAIILGAAIAASTVFGTKALIDRARGAENQAVVSNPLFEESQTEMANPAFVGETV